MDPVKRGETKYRRRNYFVKKGFQTRFMVRFLGVAVTASAMSGYIMYLLINRDVENVFYSSHISLASTGQMMLPTLVKVNSWILSVILIAAAAIIILVARKVQRPMTRLGRNIEKIARGDLSGDFTLRTDDELKGLSESLDEMTRQLKERFNELRKQADAIDNAAERLLSDQMYNNQNRPGAARKIDHLKVEELRRLARRFGDNLSIFKTGDRG